VSELPDGVLILVSVEVMDGTSKLMKDLDMLYTGTHCRCTRNIPF
jgi:hypothetical protein